MRANDSIQTGAQFGDWTVLEPFEENRLYAKCQCKCGTIKSIYRGHLPGGNTKRCRICHYASRCLNHNAYFTSVWYSKRLHKSDWPSYQHFEDWAKTNYKKNCRLLKKDASLPHGPDNSAYCKNRKGACIEVIAQHKNASIEEIEKWANTVSKQRLYGLCSDILRGKRAVLGVGRLSKEVSERSQQRLEKLIKSGMSLNEAARNTGHARQTIRRWCEMMGISPATGRCGRPPKESKVQK